MDALLSSSVGQPSTEREDGDLETGGSQMPEGHLLGLEHGLGWHLEGCCSVVYSKCESD